MATVSDSLRRSPFSLGRPAYSATHPPPKSLPILPSTAAHTTPASDPMDVSQSSSIAMAPPAHAGSSPNPNGGKAGEAPGLHAEQSRDAASQGSGGQQPVGAAAAAQQPKVVQTAFIHKLYSMLEDQSIQHLISWSNTNESFVMSPSSEFSKVLAQYFKHTNISSFVRQLNMYGFHKVSDVFHTGSPDSPLWEFKHGAGNFKRGDLVGLREIKRRASRHALIHRDSFSATGSKPPMPPQTGASLDPVPTDPVDSRLSMLEWQQQELYSRVARTEDAYAAVSAKCADLLQSLAKCHHWTQSLASNLLTLVPDVDHVVHREVYALREEVGRQLERTKASGESQDVFAGSKQPFSMIVEPSTPSSPRHVGFDDSRRPSLHAAGRPNSFRAAVPQHLQASPRRYGSVSGASGGYSPTSSRSNFPPPLPPQPPPPLLQQPHPLSNMASPPSNLSRRHTSADIRQQGWQGGQPPPHYNHGSSPYASGQSSSAWPSSPRAPPNNAGDQQIQDTLASYELPRATNINARPVSPAPPNESGVPPFSSSLAAAPSYANPNDAGWQLPGPRFPFKGLETPGPPTRRSSMASNVHSLLNPADTAERQGEDEGADDRKRKRLG